MTQIPRPIALGGGLDLVTPPIVMPGGKCIGAVNYEPAANGYRRCDGFERFDGRPKPSEQTYWVLNFDQGSAAILEGDVVTGATSSATGKALIDAVVTSGTFGGGDAAGYLVLTLVSGTYQDDENLQVSAVTKCVADGAALENGAGNDTDDATWEQDAIETARALIAKVPGSGPMRGVQVYKGDTYAFRNNAGGTAGVMHKATSSGWSAVNLGLELDFSAGGGYRIAFTSGGTYNPQVGDELTGATSGATAIIVAIDVTSGTFGGGDAAGTFLVRNQTGTFVAENLDVDANANMATVAGDSTALVLEDGDTIVGATSAAEATAERVILTSGSWAGADAAGYLVLSGQTGTFQSELLDVDGGAAGVATIGGDSSAIALPAGGTYRFVNHNFFGTSNTYRMYGVNGVGKGFEFDGTVFVPIRTGMAVDTPFLIAAHRKQLFLAFPGGSLQHSGIGEPTAWSPVLGAAELGIGEEMTDLLADVVGVLVVFGRNNVSVLYGNDSSDWDLRSLSDDAGAIGGTVQRIGAPLYVDHLGVRSLTTTQAFGDFQLGTVTRMIEPLFTASREAGLTPAASLRVRAKDTYRLYWDDGSGIAIYFGKKEPEILPFNVGKVFTCMCSGEDSSGNEILFAGDDDGWVYQLDKGTSFDGASVPAYFRLPFNHLGSPSHNKKIHKVVIEATVPSPTAQIYITPDFSYGDPDQPSGMESLLDLKGGGGFWDAAFWDVFYWDAQVHGRGEAHVDGIGLNVSFAIISDLTYDKPHTIHGLTVHYSMRGLAR